MADIGKLAILSSSSAGDGIVLTDHDYIVISPSNTSVDYHLAADVTNTVWSIETLEGETASAPNYAFAAAGVDTTGYNVTKLTISHSGTFTNQTVRLLATVGSKTIMSPPFVLTQTATGPTGKSVAIDFGSAITSVYDNAGAQFEIPFIKTFAIDNQPVQGQQLFTQNCTWTIPSNVSSVSIAAIGGGGAGGGAVSGQFGSWGKGGGGAALAWMQDVSVTPGGTLEIEVGNGGTGNSGLSGSAGGDSAVCITGGSMILCAGGGGGGTSQRGNTSNDGGSGGTYITDLTAGGSTCAGGGAGGQGGGISVLYTQQGAIETGYPGAGGGAGGYTGSGGAGGIAYEVGDANYQSAQDGNGGAGAGGYRYGKAGSTGIYGFDGTSGSAGTLSNGGGGTNGSLGSDGRYKSNGTVGDGYFGAGGGGAGWPGDQGDSRAGDSGTQGAVRIIWGNDRNYPSNRTKDLYENTSQPGTVYYTSDTPTFEYNVSTRGSTLSIPSSLSTNATGTCWLLHQFKPDASANTVTKTLCIPVLDDSVGQVGNSVGTYRVCARSLSDQYLFTANQTGVTVDIEITANPNPPTYTAGFLANSYNLTEGTTSAITVSRTATRNGIVNNNHDITVSWSISNPDSRISPTSGTVVIPAGENTASFNVSMSAGNTDSDSTTNTINITNISDPKYTISTSSATLNLNNVFRSISVASTETVEEGNSTAIEVSRVYKINGVAATPNEGSSVSWRITTANDDRISQNVGTVNFISGESTATIVIPISSESGAQTNTTNTLRLITATNNYTIVGDTCTITIQDVLAVVKLMSISVAESSVEEGNSISLVVTRTSTVDGVENYSDTPTFAWRVVGTGDQRISLSSGTGQFNAGQTSVTIGVPTTDATSYIGDTNNIFEIYNLSGGYTYPTNGNLVTVTITDNNVAPTYTFSYPNGTSVLEGNSLAINLTTTNINDGTKLNWLASSTGTTQSDFANAQTSFTYAVTNSGASAYTFNGEELSSVNNPEMTLYRGFTYTFNISASGHPFYIKTARGTGTGSLFSNGVTGNGAESGAVVFTVPLTAPDTLYYICEYHYGMSNILNIKTPNPDSKQIYVYNNSAVINVGTSDDADNTDETFTVKITDEIDSSITRATSSDITITANPVGQVAFTTPGTTTWTVPTGVTSISAVVVGGGGAGGGGSTGSYSGSGGSGGNLGFAVSIPVTGGQVLDITVGAGGTGGTGNGARGGESRIDYQGTGYLWASGGQGGLAASGNVVYTSTSSSKGGNYIYSTSPLSNGFGGRGGQSGGVAAPNSWGGGGGGAGGYSGRGGDGGYGTTSGTNGAGGGGGGSGQTYGLVGAPAGGGVGLLGEGSSGAAGGAGSGGRGGSGGNSGGSNPGGYNATNGGYGGSYGGGGGAASAATVNGSTHRGGDGGDGAVRIIWGPNRAYPSTNTGDL